MINGGLIGASLINGDDDYVPPVVDSVYETAVITSILSGETTGAIIDIAETAIIVDAVVSTSVSNEVVYETAVIANPALELQTTRTLDVTETAVITSSPPLVQVLSDNVTEAAVITDTAYASNNTEEDVAETAIIRDAVAIAATTAEDVAETAVITDGVYHASPAVDITETAVITSAAAQAVSGGLDVAETAVITSSTYPGQYELVSETAVITDAVDIDSTGVLDITETAVITSADVLVSNNVLDITETAVIGSIASHRADTVTDVLEEGFISSEVYISAHADVWTANTINWAMSVHTGLTMTGASGDFAVSEEGLWARASTYADLNMSTGHSNLGSDMLKAVPYLYTYIEHRAPLDISVTADVKGVERTAVYRQMAREATDARAVRCSIGRGFRSSYYKLNFVSSGYAQVRTCTPLIDELGRRI